MAVFTTITVLQRTTRTLSLTPDGSLYYDHCQHVLNEVQRMEANLSGNALKPRGRLRIGMTSSFARLVVLPAIKTFQASYPEIDVVLTLGDRPVELIQEGVDCVVRAGIPTFSALLVARKIGSFEWLICASPDYLQQYGAPRSLEDLAHHQVIEFHSGLTGRAQNWRFVLNDEEREVGVKGSLAVNDTDAYVTCALEGLGLIRIASFLAVQHLRAGRLAQVLEQYKAPSVPLSVIYPQNRHLSSAVRAFVHWVGERVHNVAADWDWRP
ncbi:LysR substrate-binding domain-containing protein [Advenella sp. FME57]|uniref:LysR substrate-binding domain-containing protein n=1 Tax=Advenella sp. FME57 TaxID=2742604 RepID=UPI001866B157|nr:LysR substrate-binding domain-containing protein [Advenella sp. FME57]